MLNLVTFGYNIFSLNSTGGSHYGNSHPGLGYSILNSDLPDTADSTGLGEMPGLEPGDFGVGPVYGPQLPGPFNSPVHESSSVAYGDVAGNNIYSVVMYVTVY